jgi:serine protease Do
MPDSRSSDAAVRPTLSRYPLLAVFLVGVLAQTVWGESSSRLTPVVRAVRDAMPAVVNIQGQKSIVEEESSHPVSKQVNGMGTGVLIDSRGFILTNFHVVDGVKRINVTLSTGQSYIAKIVARDPKTDLAIIRINPTVDLPVVTMGSSQGLMAGETVIAVGNAYGYENTVTTGIISALHRNVQVNETQQYLDLIQTDASINPGNSGGPLLNIDGEMIGLNVAVRAGAQGIGFAIPVDNALEVATQLMSIEQLENNWHGMATMTLPSAGGAVTIARIDRNSPAESCGLARGDTVEQIGGLPIHRPIDIERALLGHRSGESVPVLVRRDSQEMTLQLTLASRGGRVNPPAKLQDSFDTDTWDTLGLLLEEVPASYFHDRDLSYNGGMKITAVRPESSAAQQGVQAGDILIRFHRWTTANQGDVQALVNRSDTLAQEGPYRFYIVRGENTHWAEMKVATRSANVR